MERDCSVRSRYNGLYIFVLFPELREKHVEFNLSDLRDDLKKDFEAVISERLLTLE